MKLLRDCKKKIVLQAKNRTWFTEFYKCYVASYLQGSWISQINIGKILTDEKYIQKQKTSIRNNLFYE